MKTRNAALILVVLFFVAQAMAEMRPAFPLKASENRRYFVDQDGRPFLLHADTGWQIYFKLTTEEAIEYLELRKAQGFNTILTQFVMGPGDVNRYGHRPFLNDNDFARPDEAYFDHVAEIIGKAGSQGLLVLMSQPWQGCCHEGWGMTPDKPLQKNGPAKSRDLGRYFGKKFGHLKNLMWIMGGDQDPLGDRLSIEAMAEGIYETAPHQLLTYHAKPTHSSTDLYQYAPWLGFSMIYTYWRDKPNSWVDRQQMLEVYEMALREYNKTDIMPFILGESQYEGFWGNDIGTAYQVRRQAYWTILCGGTGHAYGSELWNFPANWREIAAFPGAGQLRHLYQFFTGIEWWKLEPDQKHKYVVKGFGEYTRPNYVTAAVTPDRKTLVAYLPGKQTVTVELAQLDGKRVLAEWFNPRNGAKEKIGLYRDLDFFHFTPPTDEDWLLYLRVE